MATAHELSRLINDDLEQRLQATELVDWAEDHLSIMLVEALRNILRKISTISAPKEHRPYAEERNGTNFFFEVEVYKATGALERKHGDIAIVVEDVDLHRAGTGFYEAKAEGPCGGFPAFNMRQLRRLSSATPQLSLLLYQRSRESVSDDEYSLSKRLDRPPSATSRLRVIGANIAKRYKSPEDIPDLPQTFGHHFVSRYLSGRDLDYSRDPLLAIERWLKVTRRASPLRVSIWISRTASALEEPARILPPGYERIPLLQSALFATLPPDPSIERTRPGKPGRASHVKR
jgi:hypothetical protein